MGALEKLHENSYLKKEIWTKKRVCKEWWGGEQEKENSKTNGMEKTWTFQAQFLRSNDTNCQEKLSEFFEKVFKEMSMNRFGLRKEKEEKGCGTVTTG